MKTSILLLLLSALAAMACTKKANVLCNCGGVNAAGQNSYMDFGIQKNPSTKAFAAKCDSFGVHNGLDSCYLIIEGK